MLEYLATTRHVRKLAFIGGTSLRLLKGIGRFSEDLDFDCKGLDEATFRRMTDDVLAFLTRSEFKPEARAGRTPEADGVSPLDSLPRPVV
ncbi:MAG: nucleotidyl transferase AbiEii/AbiGii toxin family protein [Desulfobacterales bacterium]|nr:nucleotidyl transferase AbiEii/AbiGii toxin family protein [Desulfobacterales bacterium]